MKKHLVVICGVIHPSTTPTSQCAINYAKLLTREFNVEMIGISNSGMSCAYTIENNIRISALSNKWILLSNKGSNITKCFFHRLQALPILFTKLGNLAWFERKASVELERINTLHKVDALFTICSPITAHLAGIRFAETHNVVHCAYTVDTYSAKDRIKPLFNTFQSLVRYEKYIYRKIQTVLFSEEIAANRADLLGGLTNYKVLPYLLPKIVDNDTDSDNYFLDNKIHCVYAGSFYSNIRNPDFMLRIFSAISNGDIVLDLFSSGCESIISQYQKKSHNIVSHGYVSKKELDRVYQSANVLIGVGNTLADFLPSKTFEYISKRKPIIFFNPGLTQNNVLDQYPLQLQINEEMTIEKGASLLCEFCERNQSEYVEDDVIKVAYKKHSEESILSILIDSLS